MPKRRVRRHEVIQPLDQSYRLIPLTQGQNAIVDTEDFDWLNQWNWIAMWDQHTKSFRALRRKGPRGSGAILMHRAILDCVETEQVDHRNHDTLDNRRENLRKCTLSQNVCNKRGYAGSSSIFKGVSFDKSSAKWCANIQINGHQKWLGRFDSQEKAARAYDKMAKIYHGEFAYLNFPTHDGIPKLVQSNG
jgi:hypothetical protein